MGVALEEAGRAEAGRAAAVVVGAARACQRL